MINFEGHINGSKPVVVDFFAEWCSPCKLMTSELHKVKEMAGERATVLKIDIDKNPDYMQLYNIRSVPTLIIFKNGHMLWRKNGIANAYEILQSLNQHLS